MKTCDENKISKIELLKKDFLRGLGSSSDKALIDDLDSAFLGDNYQSNVVNIFKRFHQEKFQDTDQNSTNFLDLFKDWAGNNLDQEFKNRYSIAVANSCGLVVACLLNFFATPIAGIACGTSVVGLSSIAESTAKRNISNIGHLSTHFANKLDGATMKMIEDFTGFFGESSICDEKVEKDRSAPLRILSYFSSATLSIAEKISTRFSLLAESTSFVVSSVIGSFIPVLPLVSFKLAKISANIRQKRLEKVVEKFQNTVDKMIEMVKDRPDERDSIDKMKEIFQNFSQNLKSSDSHGKKAKTPKHNKDKISNPSKIISLGSWGLSKVRQAFKNSVKSCFKKNNIDEDLTIVSSEFAPSSEIYESLKPIQASPMPTNYEPLNLVDPAHRETDRILRLQNAYKEKFRSPTKFEQSPKSTQLNDDKFYEALNSYYTINYSSSYFPFSNSLNSALKLIYPDGQHPHEIDKPSAKIRFKSFQDMNQLMTNRQNNFTPNMGNIFYG